MGGLATATLIVLVIVVIITWSCCANHVREMAAWVVAATCVIAGAMWIAARSPNSVAGRGTVPGVERELMYSASVRPSTLVLGDSNSRMIVAQNKSPHLGTVSVLGKSIAGVSKLWRDPGTTKMLAKVKRDQPDNIILMFGTVDIVTCFYYNLWLERESARVQQPRAYAKTYARTLVSKYTRFIKEVRAMGSAPIVVLSPSYIPLSSGDLRDGLQSRWLRGNRPGPEGRVIPEGELWPAALDEYISQQFRTTLVNDVHEQLTRAVTLLRNVRVVSLNPITSDENGWVRPEFAPSQQRDVHLNPVTVYPLLVSLFEVPGLDMANFVPVANLYA
jgi:hypothetical protein